MAPIRRSALGMARTRTPMLARTPILALGSLVAFVTTLPPVAAHGGNYRGPTPATQAPPPSPRKPNLPAPMTPRGATTPGAPGAGLPGPTTPRSGGVDLAPDVTRWQVWWEFNKDRFLSLREQMRRPIGPVTGSSGWFTGSHRSPVAGRGPAPDAAQIHDVLQPALRRALADTTSPDLITGCLVALAKIGTDHRDFDLLPLLAGFLDDDNQEVRETAALALGITRQASAIGMLRDLLLDTATGRKLARRAEVDRRMRAFAAYGLGVLAAGSHSEAKAVAVDTLLAVLRYGSVTDWDVQVAAISALGVLDFAPSNSTEKRLLWRSLADLRLFHEKDLGRGAEIVQAHVPVAIGRLLKGRANSDRTAFRQRFAEELDARDRPSAAVQQSLAIALGLLADPEHEEIGKQLLDLFEGGRDQQAGYFSLIAMGEIGGDANRTRLLRVLVSGSKAMERPWAGIALGVLTYEARRRPGGVVDTGVGHLLLQQLRGTKNRSAAGAYAIALGLCGHTDAAGPMRDLLRENKERDEFAGHLCIGLALMPDTASADAIRHVLHASVRRPELFRQAAVALGMLRDKAVVGELLERITEDDPNTARMAAIASALQLVGDRNTVSALVEKLGSKEITNLSRAFVAAALGGIADPMLLPFNARYAADCNYRAVVETLSNQATGILDLL